MGRNGARDDVVELWGHEFRRVKNGLDEAQVVSFINGLVSQRDALLQREEHLSSLNKLAEKTVAEADKLSDEIKSEAREQARIEAATIVAKAEEQAQQILEEKRAEAVNIADEQAAVIKAEARQEAESLLEEQRKRIEPELSDFVHRLYSQLLSEIENLKQQTIALETEFKYKLSQPVEGTSSVAPVEDKGGYDAVGKVSSVVVEENERYDAIEEANITTAGEDERHDEFLELIQTTDQVDTGEPEWELQILPPLGITNTIGIVTYLDNLPEVEKTEIITAQANRPSIMVFLRQPVDLIDMIKALPQVAEVKEDVIDTTSTDSKPRKLQIVLSGEALPQEIN